MAVAQVIPTFCSIVLMFANSSKVKKDVSIILPTVDTGSGAFPVRIAHDVVLWKTFRHICPCRLRDGMYDVKLLIVSYTLHYCAAL